MIKVNNVYAIYTSIDGKINLITKNNNLFITDCNEEIDEFNKKYIKNNINIDSINLKQCYTFSKKNKDCLEISILFVDIVNYKDINNKDFNFIPFDKLDLNNKYINKSLEYLKLYLKFYSSIKRLYPNEFILPEIQKLYEDLLGKKYDRRNFRKKLMQLDIIEDLNKLSDNKLGRPAKLYKFKELDIDKILL